MAGDEQVRARAMAFRQPRQVLNLTEDECWALLDSVSVGRVLFTMKALPAIRLVNHIVDLETIIFRSHLGAEIVKYAGQDGAVVCYEADQLDPVRRTGWSVTMTGLARLVSATAAVARYEQLLEPWVEGQMDYVIAVKPEILTGVRLVGWCR